MSGKTPVEHIKEFTQQGQYKHIQELVKRKNTHCAETSPSGKTMADIKPICPKENIK